MQGVGEDSTRLDWWSGKLLIWIYIHTHIYGHMSGKNSNSYLLSNNSVQWHSAEVMSLCNRAFRRRCKWHVKVSGGVTGENWGLGCRIVNSPSWVFMGSPCLFFFLALPQGMRNLISLTRIKPMPTDVEAQVLTTGTARKSQEAHILALLSPACV